MGSVSAELSKCTCRFVHLLVQTAHVHKHTKPALTGMQIWPILHLDVCPSAAGYLLDTSLTLALMRSDAFLHIWLSKHPVLFVSVTVLDIMCVIMVLPGPNLVET